MHIQSVQSPSAYQDNLQVVGNNRNSQEKTSVAKEESKHEEICVASTDRVDGEIAMLKAKEAQLASKLGSMDKESAEYGALEQELSQVENELSRKDNDTYRRQNTDFSSGVDIDA